MASFRPPVSRVYVAVDSAHADLHNASFAASDCLSDASDRKLDEEGPAYALDHDQRRRATGRRCRRYALALVPLLVILAIVSGIGIGLTLSPRVDPSLPSLPTPLGVAVFPVTHSLQAMSSSTVSSSSGGGGGATATSSFVLAPASAALVALSASQMD